MTPDQLKTIRQTLALSQPQMSRRVGRSVRQYKAYELGEAFIPDVVSMAVEKVYADMTAAKIAEACGGKTRKCK